LGASAYPVTRFDSGDFTGEIVQRWCPADGRPELIRELARLLDPAAAEKTLHWGRNYIYLAHLQTPDGPLPVAVKQFTHDRLRPRLDRRVKGSKARRSWNVARALRQAGVDTPEPVLLADSKRPDGPSYFVTRHLPDAFEARYLFRAMNDGTAAEAFPQVDVDRFLARLARAIRNFHDGGFWHRDLSSGNVLVRWPEPAGDRDEGEAVTEPRFSLLDLNRTRVGGKPSVSERTRDLSRLMIFRPEHQRRFVSAYWDVDPRALGWRWRLFKTYHDGFLAKNETKKRLRKGVSKVKGWVVSRGAHGHIPEAPEGAGARDRVVWDYLSDQPHLHAGRFEKLAARLRDAGAHAAQTRALLGALPAVRRRYRSLKADLYRQPVPFAGAGIALRPASDPSQDEELLAAFDDLGARHALVRLHPWQDDHDREEALVKALAERGVEISYALPQNRDLVKDAVAGGHRWRDALEELGERFAPHGKAFQVGQAVNRSKWGVWNSKEYALLAQQAEEVLRRHDGVELLGPAVIDFELHATAALVNLAKLGARFDALASLLYVDRRGAPENRQLGFDTVDKVLLLQAIADTARHCGARSWITEVNWPLREGPHSPAGKGVSVDEETQADYLARFYLLALSTGRVERVFWWRLAAKGYGLVDPGVDGSTAPYRRRPAFAAFAHLLERLGGPDPAVCHGPLLTAEPARLFRFTRSGEDGEVLAGWSTDGSVEVELPSRAERVWDRDGRELDRPDGTQVTVGPSVRYFALPATT
jgi:hypothetical protein